MSADAFRQGFVSLFYSAGHNPLSLWDKQVKNGHIRRVVDDEVKSLVLEISGTNVATTYITSPIKPRASLGIRLPFLVMIVKNMKRYFTFEILILDDKDMHRRFRVSNFQSTTKVRPFCTTMPIGLSSGWNQIQFNLADFTRRAYGSTYLETMRIQIHANVRIRRIYFSDRLYSEDEMPAEFKLFVPPSKTRESLQSRTSKDDKRKSKEGKPPAGVAPLKLEEQEQPPPPTPVEESPRVEQIEVEQEGPPQEPEFTETPTTDEATTEPTEPTTPSEGPPDSDFPSEPVEEGAETQEEAGPEEAAPAEDTSPAEDAQPQEDVPPQGDVIAQRKSSKLAGEDDVLPLEPPPPEEGPVDTPEADTAEPVIEEPLPVETEPPAQDSPPPEDSPTDTEAPPPD